MVADDLASDNWYVDEETQDLRLKDPKAPRAEPTYLEILRVRNERKYGRRRFSRRSMPPPPQRMPGSGSSFVNGSSSSKPKEENLMSDNHLRPPSKKSPKSLRSVAEGISIPVPSLHKPENEQPKETNLLDDLVPEDRLDLASKVLEEIRLDDPEPEENKAKVVLV
ncbi:Cell wall assembly regulator [Rhizina undulata]